MAARNLIVALMIVFLVSLMYLSFASEFISIKNPNSPLINGTEYGLSKYTTSLNKTLSNFDEFVRNQEEILGNAEPNAIEYVFLFAKELFVVPINILGFLFTGILNYGALILSIGQQTLLGGAISIAISLIIAGLIITTILYAIQLIRTGQGAT